MDFDRFSAIALFVISLLWIVICGGVLATGDHTVTSAIAFGMLWIIGFVGAWATYDAMFED